MKIKDLEKINDLVNQMEVHRTRIREIADSNYFSMSSGKKLHDLIPKTNEVCVAHPEPGGTLAARLKSAALAYHEEYVRVIREELKMFGVED